MKFDFTQKVVLEGKNYKIYRTFQVLLYLVFFVFTIYLAFALFFPSGYFTFSFANFNSIKNTFKDPRNNQEMVLEKGKIKADETMLADTSLIGSYSKAVFSFDLGKKSAKMSSGKIEVRKSYRAFFLPKGDPIGFPSGSLLKNGNDFYIISEGKLRKFSAIGEPASGWENKNLALSMGFSESGFLDATSDDLNYNPKGEAITAGKDYPNDSLFKIGDNFYILTEGKLGKFVSENAYLSRFKENQIVIKDENFLKNFEVSEDLLGFSDGTLIAYGISAYIVSGKEILPIGSAKTFEADGFSWGDLINISGDEISLYKKGKFFSLDSSHPNGIIFLSKENNRFYMIKDNEKHLLPTDIIAESWLMKRTPVLVSEKSLDVSSGCSFQEKTSILGASSYQCEIPIENLTGFIGKDYEFRFTPENDIEINQMSVRFKKTVNWLDFKQSVLNILGKVKGNYAK